MPMVSRNFNLKVKAFVAADLDELVEEVNNFLANVEWANIEPIQGLPVNIFGMYVIYE